MNGASENRVEQEVPEGLGHYGLTLDDITIGGLGLESLDPDKPPELLCQLRKLSLLCEEPLTMTCSPSDVDPRQDRLLIPKDRAKDFIERYSSDKKRISNGIPIRVYHTDETHYPLLFKQRDDGKYVITHRGRTHWRDVCRAIQLEAGVNINLWTLRHSETNELCFFVVKNGE